LASAATGKEAIALVGELRPDVLVVDYMLPDLNGIEIFRRLTGPYPDLRAVLISGSGISQELVAAALYVGFSEVVEKTRAVSDLANSIRRAARDEVLVERSQLVGLARGTVSAEALTPREGEVLVLVADGRSSKDIAGLLDLSLNSVRNHVQHLLVKLNAHSKLEAVAKARDRGLL